MFDRKLQVFLCHSSIDKPIVRELYYRLLAEGWIDPWLDEMKLIPGQDWDLEIEKAVESADVVIACLSNNSISKDGYIQKELKKVLDIAERKPEGEIYVIPLRLDDCRLPRKMKSLHYLDYFPYEDQEINILKLFKALKRSYYAYNEELEKRNQELSEVAKRLQKQLEEIELLHYALRMQSEEIMDENKKLWEGQRIAKRLKSRTIRSLYKLPKGE
jgi:hypothetical protein